MRASVIGHDTALVVSLLEMVNRMTAAGGVQNVNHAAAMLGQKELKRWISTAITKELLSDKPTEIMRLSLIRARFAENLSKVFELAAFSQDLFLAGMFSVVDIMLDKPMEEGAQRFEGFKKYRRRSYQKIRTALPRYKFCIRIRKMLRGRRFQDLWFSEIMKWTRYTECILKPSDGTETCLKRELKLNNTA